MNLKNSSSTEPRQIGFDAAVRRREDDFLNRWPLAKEIYGIAITGPQDWSVRVGIYGEWGTGKTSVLEFISEMAKQDGQILIRFNPWEHSTKDSLWRSFVLTVFKEPALAKIAGATKAKAKGVVRSLFKGTDIIKSGVDIYNDKAGQAVGSGLDFAKAFFSFGQNDLKSLRQELGNKRIIVLIDDLDRTAPELVPEILFALKELMDIPGFAFICSFDPVVVGEVLGEYHPGFGDGLKFLEKIIDYPRWLPPASVEGMANLAVADANRYCNYVPSQALRDAIPLLPQNPRAVRQFIRLLSLLKPQIQRHNETELRWPVILAANVLKIRQVRLAQVLLNDQTFWGKIGFIPLMAKNNAEAELDKALAEHLDNCAVKQNLTLASSEREQILAAMKYFSSNTNVWFGSGAEALVYQMNLAESPHAVTWKEFDEFFIQWELGQTQMCAIEWIANHSRKVERSKMDVYRELLGASLERYSKVLQESDTAYIDAEKATLSKKAHTLISMVECLTLELGQIGQPEKQISDDLVETLFDKFTNILKSNNPTWAEFYQKNEAILINLIKRWGGDVSHLVDVISPYGYFGSRFDGPQVQALHQRLKEAILPKYVAQIIDGFRHSDYLKRVWEHEKIALQLRCILRASDGPLWGAARKELFAVFQEAGDNQIVQENVYSLLLWFDHILREEQMTGDTESVKKLLQNNELLVPTWNAATAKPLSSYSTIRLNRLVENLKKLDVNVNLPTWWDGNIKSFALPTPAEAGTD
jgi:hypothetical protein